MGWRLTEHRREYESAALPFLREEPVLHTVSLTVLETLRAAARVCPEPPLFGWWTGPGGRVAGAFSHTPPYELLLATLPDEAVGPLAEALADWGRPLRGVHGTRRTAPLFADAWARRTGCGVRVSMEQRLYALTVLVPLDPAPGRARPAGREDTDVLVEWLRLFNHDVGMPDTNNSQVVEERLGYGGFVVWETGGLPVAAAGLTRPAGSVVRIGPVFTPEEHRRHGYGSAVTAAASRTALDRGADAVVLFTDLANPTSNSIYQRLGYQPVEERLVLGFDRPG
ncbi:MAG: GNAT family N-acetyltransferase [Streptomycetales bacterium]